jgi:hypothetical protein
MILAVERGGGFAKCEKCAQCTKQSEQLSGKRGYRTQYKGRPFLE